MRWTGAWVVLLVAPGAWGLLDVSSEPEVAIDLHPREQNEPAVAANPRDPQHLVVAAHSWEWPPYHVFAHRSLDGGLTWAKTPIPVPAPYVASADPSVAFDRQGRVYAGVLGLRGPADDARAILLARSDDGGASWTTTRVAAGNLYHDKPWVAIDTTGGPHDGRVYVAWSIFTQYLANIVVAHSDDGGQTWSTPVELSGPFVSSIGASPAVAADGTLHVAWLVRAPSNDVPPAPALILHARLRDGVVERRILSVAVAPASEIPFRSFRLLALPSLAAGPQGELAVAWADWRNGNTDILVARSLDGGATWGEPARANDGPLLAEQFMPALGIGPDGSTHVVFYDTRDDPANRRMHAYAASAPPGGSFGASVRLSSVASDPEEVWPGGPLSLGFWGDYIGLAALPSGAFAVWTDGRNGTFDDRNQDLYGARFGP